MRRGALKRTAGKTKTPIHILEGAIFCSTQKDNFLWLKNEKGRKLLELFVKCVSLLRKFKLFLN
jgi:hypothetical protein